MQFRVALRMRILPVSIPDHELSALRNILSFNLHLLPRNFAEISMTFDDEMRKIEIKLERKIKIRA